MYIGIKKIFNLFRKQKVLIMGNMLMKFRDFLSKSHDFVRKQMFHLLFYFQNILALITNDFSKMNEHVVKCMLLDENNESGWSIFVSKFW